MPPDSVLEFMTKFMESSVFLGYKDKVDYGINSHDMLIDSARYAKSKGNLSWMARNGNQIPEFVQFMEVCYIGKFWNEKSRGM
jgi:hypothetical protein